MLGPFIFLTADVEVALERMMASETSYLPGTSQSWALAPQSPAQGALSYPFPTLASGMAPPSASIGSRGIPATCNAQYVTYAVRLDTWCPGNAVNNVDGCGAKWTTQGFVHAGQPDTAEREQLGQSRSCQPYRV